MIVNIWTLATTQEHFIPFYFQAASGLSTLNYLYRNSSRISKEGCLKSNPIFMKIKTPETSLVSI